jgi:catechol 2,3-dioxygenase
MTSYYRDGVHLEVLTESGPRVVLDRGATPVVVLEHAPELKHASAR